jgi:hypothetical protein
VLKAVWALDRAGDIGRDVLGPLNG